MTALTPEELRIAQLSWSDLHDELRIIVERLDKWFERAEMYGSNVSVQKKILKNTVYLIQIERRLAEPNVLIRPVEGPDILARLREVRSGRSRVVLPS